MDEASLGKTKLLLSGGEIEEFGLGKDRTLCDYEAYSGLSFRHHKAQRYTLQGNEPPNPDAPADWPNRMYPWIAKIRFKSDQLPPGALDDPMCWNLSILGEDGEEVCQRNVTADELAPLAGVEGELVIVCEFLSNTIPANWTLWPLTRAGHWLPRFAGSLSEDDFAVVRDEE